MPFVTPPNPNKGKELPEASTYVWRVYSVVHQWTTHGRFWPQNQMIFRVELPTELTVFKPENGEQPFAVNVYVRVNDAVWAQTYNLLKALWAITAEEDKKYLKEKEEKKDQTYLLVNHIEKAAWWVCNITVSHNEGKNGMMYLNAKATDMKPAVKWSTVPDQINESQFFFMDATYYQNWMPKADKPEEDELRLFYCENVTVHWDIGKLLEFQADKVAESWEWNSHKKDTAFPPKWVDEYLRSTWVDPEAMNEAEMQ